MSFVCKNTSLIMENKLTKTLRERNDVTDYKLGLHA